MTMSEPLQARLRAMADQMERAQVSARIAPFFALTPSCAELLREAAAALAGEDSPVSPADQKGPHIAAVEYARSYVVPLYRNGEEGTPYERGMVRSVAQHWLAGYFAAKPPNESELVSPAGAEQESIESAAAKTCGN